MTQNTHGTRTVISKMAGWMLSAVVEKRSVGTTGFVTSLLQKSLNKFFNRHGLIVVKYGATLGLNSSIVSLHYLFIIYFFSCILVRVRAQFYFVRVHYLLI